MGQASPYQFSWVTPPVSTLAVDNSVAGTPNTSTTTLKTVTISAGTMSTNDSVSIKTSWGITVNTVNATCFHTILVGNGTATSTLMNDYAQQINAAVYFNITNKNSLSLQFIHGMRSGGANDTTGIEHIWGGGTTTAYNTANNIYVTFQSRTANASQSCGLQTMLVQLIKI